MRYYFFLYLCAQNLVNNLDLYIISLKGLSSGDYAYDWKLDDKFFALFETSEISDAEIDVQLVVVKHSRYFDLSFDLDGWAQVSCDRCLDPVKLEISLQSQMIVRFGECAGEDQSDENDVVILPYGEEQLDVAQYLYEFAHLSLPIRRVHQTKESCNADMITKLEKFLIN